ncbi:MAG: methyltransferase domain-containing protein [Bacteroidales bacterium]|jgi:2-polyprenyl-3-methyl-5-hydroxy-6-metoxy-1,4-benzoquinol methylase
MNEFDLKARDWDKNKMNMERTMAVGDKLLRHLPETATLKAMEFGAGTGLLSFYLKDRFSEITLMDNSIEMLKAAEEKMEKSDRLKLKTLYFDLESAEYKGTRFDVIYSQMVLHHIKDTEVIFKRLCQLLNPGGVLAFADLYEEDGSFHDFNPDVLKGFDPEKLRPIVLKQGFKNYNAEPCFVIRREDSEGNPQEYPLFLITMNK